MSAATRREHPIEAISAFIDGELGGAELEAVESHLAGCESCRKLAEDLRRIALAVPEAARSDIPAGLEARIKSRLRHERQTSRHRRFVLPVGIAATIGALALLATVQVQRSKPLHEPAAPVSVMSPGDERGEPAPDEVTAAKKSSESDASGIDRRSNRAFGSREDKVVPLQESAEGGKSEAPSSAAKDQVSDTAAPAAPPPAEAAPQPARDRERSAVLSKAQAEREHQQAAESRGAEAPPPPPPAASELRMERARQTISDDAKKAKEESRVADREVVVAPGGVIGGVAGAMSDRPASDQAPPCPSPWRTTVEVSWDTARSGDPQSVLATVARDHSGQVIAGRDERGPFVSLLLPAAAWPEILENLRALGAFVSSVPPPPLPDGTLCVRLDVRVSEIAPR